MDTTTISGSRSHVLQCGSPTATSLACGPAARSTTSLPARLSVQDVMRIYPGLTLVRARAVLRAIGFPVGREWFCRPGALLAWEREQERNALHGRYAVANAFGTEVTAEAVDLFERFLADKVLRTAVDLRSASDAPAAVSACSDVEWRETRHGVWQNGGLNE